MAQIIQAYRRPSPIAEAVKNAAQSYFGDRLKSALEQAQLQEARDKNDALRAITDQYGQNTGAAMALGADPGKFNLYTQSLNPNLDPYSMDAGRAQMGAGMSASSWGPSFIRDQARQSAEEAARLGETRRYHNAGLAQDQSQFNASLAEQQRQYNLKPFPAIDPNTNQPVLMTQQTAPGNIPILSQTEAQGTLLQGLNRTGALSPTEQRVAAGAVPSETQARGGIIESLGQSGNLTTADQRSLIGLDRPPETLTTWQDPQGGRHSSADGGRTDASTGQPIPGGSVRLGAVGPGIQDPGVLKNTNSTNSNLQQGILASDSLLGDLSQIEMLYQHDPNAFGFTGELATIARPWAVAATEIGKLFGRDYEAQVEKSLGDLVADPNVDQTIKARIHALDPSLTTLDYIETSLAYKLAKARDPGGRVSDQDFRNALSSVSLRGLKTPEMVQQRLNDIRSNIEAQRHMYLSAMQNGIGAAPPPAAPAPAPAPTGGADLRYDAATGKLVPVQ